MFIENCSVDDVRKAFHHDPGPNSMLIQIVDPDMDWPTPKYPFKEKFGFKFWDVDEIIPGSINLKDAQNIATCLRRAYDNRMNVIVHCVAGICRSGAVVDAGHYIGFEPVEKLRISNRQVRSMILKALNPALERSKDGDNQNVSATDTGGVDTGGTGTV